MTERLDRWTGGRLPRWLAESLGVSLAAQAATLPIVLASFGRLAVIAPAVNLVVVPLVAPAMAAGTGRLARRGARRGGWAGGRRHRRSRHRAGSPCGSIIGIVDVAAALPMASVAFDASGGRRGSGSASRWSRRWRWRRGASAGAPTTARSVDGARTARGDAPPSRRSMPLRLATVGLIVAVAVAGARRGHPAGRVARVTVLDVGQGDAILVEGSRGGRLLVDGGPDPDRLLVELDRRIPPWDRRIDVVVLTHPHEDHVAGLALLLDRYRVGRVLEPGMRGPGPGLRGVARAHRRRARVAGRGSIAAGDRLRSTRSASASCGRSAARSRPSRPTPARASTTCRSCCSGPSATRRFLLTGDVEEEIDPSLLAAGPAAGRPAQGRPPRQPHGHDRGVRGRGPAARGDRLGRAPATRTAIRLGRRSSGWPRAGARVYRTDRDGTVSVAVRRGWHVGPTTAPRRPRSAAVPRRAARTVAASFLCAVPLQPFVPAVAAPPPATRLHDAAAALGYHPADDDPRPPPGRCPALARRPRAALPSAGSSARR